MATGYCCQILCQGYCVQFVGVVLDSQFGAGVATTQLAVADYAPDGKYVFLEKENKTING